VVNALVFVNPAQLLLLQRSAEMSLRAEPSSLSDSNVVNSRQDVDTLDRQFQEWDLEHSKMKERPPKESSNYIRHARNILPLLESLAEVHPVAKGLCYLSPIGNLNSVHVVFFVAVVFTFRAVVTFQHDRIENDLRMNCIFLTQTDMMRVVLE
jgi:hypothetical protein